MADFVHEDYAPLAARIAALAAGRTSPAPAIVGIAGGVAAGKSTAARTLADLLGGLGGGLDVEVVSTDAFLYSNEELEERHLVLRKGFPESYDRGLLTAFLEALRAGEDEVAVPVYDHRVYDVVPGQSRILRRPDVVLLEGINALAPPAVDLLDLAVYIDADEADLRRWFTERFLSLTAEATNDPGSFFARWAALPADQVVALAASVWDNINGVNLADHILPTRDRADVVLVKGPDHRITQVRLRPTM